MKAGRDFDILVSTQILGHTVHRQKNVFFEATPKGTRPLQSYSTSIEAAWEVVQSQGITLLPIEGGAWFALVGPHDGWKSPADFLRFLSTADFAKAGAAVSDSAPYSVCMAAWNKVQKKQEEASGLSLVPADESEAQTLN